MYWIAENQQGEIITLTEREALTHFERNNIANRMRLRFLGTTDGKNTIESKENIKKLIVENRPESFGQMTKEDQNITDAQIRAEHSEEIGQMLQEAMDKDIEDAKANGVKQPRQSLKIHTKSTEGHSRQEILNSMNGMLWTRAN